MEDLLAQGAALAEVILIDLALSADNAVAVGLAAAALPDDKRQKAVTWGILIALGLRILFGLIAVYLLQIHGLLLVGGLMLLYIAYRMWKDMQTHENIEAEEKAGHPEAHAGDITFGRAMFSIVLANIALSLDNVLAVAGVSRHAPVIMAIGVVLAVILMGVAASYIAKIIDDKPWIAVAGIAVIVLAGNIMMWEDLHYFLPSTLPAVPTWLGGSPHHAALSSPLG